MKGPAKSSLTESRQRLVEWMLYLQFGKIEQLPIRNGDPVLTPRPRATREVKLCGENGSRPEREAADFLLKQQVVELFGHFDRIGTGTVQLLEIKNGLPFRFLVPDAA
jgi:hypothetical protein